MFKDVWAAVISEKFVCKTERNNRHDIYAVAVMKGEVVVGHLQCKISHAWLLFLREMARFFAMFKEDDDVHSLD